MNPPVPVWVRALVGVLVMGWLVSMPVCAVVFPLHRAGGKLPAWGIAALSPLLLACVIGIAGFVLWCLLMVFGWVFGLDNPPKPTVQERIADLERELKIR